MARDRSELPQEVLADAEILADGQEAAASGRASRQLAST